MSGDVWISNLTLEAVGAAGDESELAVTINSLLDSVEADIPATPVNGRFKIAEADPAEFEVRNLVINPQKVAPGEAVTISATVTNVGDEEGTHTVTLKIGGIVIETRSVTQAAGARETVAFTVTKDTAATYSVEVDGLRGNFKVAVPIVEPPVEPSIPGFGAVLAIGVC